MKGGIKAPDISGQSEGTDDQLMSRLAEGETRVLGELYTRYDRMVKAAICQFAPEMSRADIEEVAQEVFVEARGSIGVRPTGSVRVEHGWQSSDCSRFFASSKDTQM